MVLFDTHTHYDDEKFDFDRDSVIRSLNEKNPHGKIKKEQQTADYL